MYLNNKIIIEQDVDGIFLADVPELPGCHTQGQTLEEVRERVKEAIELWFEVKK
jgi:predicted RNase H-like HicB family nuclease